MKLFNKSKRIVQTENGDFKPETTYKASKEEGAKLLRLFGGELINLDTVGENDADTAEVVVAKAKTKKAEKAETDE